MPLHPAIGWDGGIRRFAICSQTMILQLSTSQVAQIPRITSLSHGVCRSCLLYLFFFCGTGIWTQGFTLAKQVLHHLNLISSPFCSVYLEMEVSWTICPGWPHIVNLPISASQEARITGMSHRHSKKLVISNVTLQIFFLIGLLTAL
jgi:hypothetical protein